MPSHDSLPVPPARALDARPRRSSALRRALVAGVALLVAACSDGSSSPAEPSSGSSTTVAGAGGAGGAGGATTTCPEAPARAWYQFGLGDDVLDQVTLFYLGHAWDQSADVGEVLETASRVDPADESSWGRAWRATAERLRATASASEAAGHPMSASHAYLRAATYYRAALHHQIDPFASEVVELAQAEVDCFRKHLTLSKSPCEPVEIPYESTTLPAYFCRSPLAKGPAPTLLFQEGRDAWAEDGKYVADEAMKRGQHALLFDGPGMGKVLRLQKLPFRHDWEKVVTPIVDWLVARPEVDGDRLGMISLSMGGYLGPRAAAFEHRIKMLVANPGVLDWGAVLDGYLQAIDPTLLPLLETDEAAFDAAIEAYMSQSPFLRWGLVDFMWHHGVSSPAKLLKEVHKYALGDVVSDIASRTLVVDAEAEQWGQSKALYDALTCPKDLLTFTAAETAQFHVQPGASAIASQRLLDWLEGGL